jgi:hypothetical protein
VRSCPIVARAGAPDLVCVAPAVTTFEARQARVLNVDGSANDMLRRVLLILSVVGLVGSVGLWGLSCLTAANYVPQSRSFKLMTLENTTVVKKLIGRPRGMPAKGLPARVRRAGATRGPLTVSRSRLPNVYEISSQPGRQLRISSTATTTSLSLWFLSLMFAIYPAALVPSWLRTRRRRRLGHCLQCGYNLIGSPGACPECGRDRE